MLAASTPVVNTQNPYPASNFLKLFNTLDFSYQLPTFSYTNYTLNSRLPSLTSSSTSAGIYSIPLSQPNIISYFLHPTSDWSSWINSSQLVQRLSFSYQSPFGTFDYQPAYRQGLGNTNFAAPYTASYRPSVMSYMPFVSSISNAPSIYYPGYMYPWTPPTTYHQQQLTEVIGTIGIITDVHYTDENSTDRRLRNSVSGPRFYSEAGDDLADFVYRMNYMKVNAAIELGDFIDVHSGNCFAEGNSNTHDDGAHGEAILSEVESIYSNLMMPYYHVIGNWDMYDFDFATANEWFKYIVNGTPATIESLGGKRYTDALGNPVSRYYSFRFGNVLGIVLDSSGSGVSGDNYLMNTTGINGSGYVPQKQLDWLEEVLADNAAGTNMPVVVFLHTFLYPIFSGTNYYMCRNHSSVRSILQADENVIAVFNGHHHPGAQGWWEDTEDDPDSNEYHSATGVFGAQYKGIKYYNLRGSIIGWGSDSAGPIEKRSNAYYVLTVKKGLSISIDVQSFRTN